jgi:hypothetical protein
VVRIQADLVFTGLGRQTSRRHGPQLLSHFGYGTLFFNSDHPPRK